MLSFSHFNQNLFIISANNFIKYKNLFVGCYDWLMCSMSIVISKFRLHNQADFSLKLSSSRPTHKIPYHLSDSVSSFMKWEE